MASINTGPASSHAHTTSGKTSTKNGGHAHTVDLTDYALAADLAALTARVAALEGGTTPTPIPIPPPTTTTNVSSITGLLTALADNTVTDITVANGTYSVSGATAQATNSLWIGAKFASRTSPVAVHPATPGGVTFDGGGQIVGIAFEEGAHDQTWDGFGFTNFVVRDSGCIVFGGYSTPGAFNITLRNFSIPNTVKGSGTTAQGYARDHGVYFSGSSNGIHDILIENLTVDGSGGLASAVQWDNHGTGASISKVTIRNLTAKTLQQAILMWQGMTATLIDGGTITGSTQTAVTYQYPSSGNVIQNLTSTGTPSGNGLYAPNGTSGLSITNSSLH